MSVALCRSALPSGCLAAILLLSGCGKHPAAAPPTAAAARSTAAPADGGPPPSATANAPAANGSATMTPAGSASAAQTLAVTAVVLGNAVNADRNVSRASQVFAPDVKTIYASVATSGRSDQAVLATQWSWLRGEGMQFSRISASIATDGPAITTFKVQNPDHWPPGKYDVVVTLDGKQVARREFEIRKD